MTTETAPSNAISKYGKFEVHSAAETRESGYCILLTGAAGAGKTTLAGSAADSDADSPVVFLDAEGGVKAISHRDDVMIIHVNSWDDLKTLTNQMKADANLPFKTVVLDNLSEFIQLAIVKIVGNATDQTTLPKYGEMAREVLALVRNYRDMARLRGINSIIIAWDSIEEDKAKRAIQTFNATPKLREDLPGIVDIIGHVDKIDGQPDVRVLNFETSTRTINKFRRNTSDTGKSIPHKIAYSLDNLPMQDILAALKRNTPFPVEKYPPVAVRS